MSRQTFRLNLTASEFPFLSGNYGRSIVYPQQDMHYIRPNAFTGTEADKNIGIPQLIFCENVMPASWGLQSISYTLAIAPTAVQLFDQALYVRDAAENRTLFVPGINGITANRYTYNATSQVWASSAVAVPAGATCTVASLKKRTFVKFSFDAFFYEWTGSWGTVAFSGIVAANIMGVVAANTYLVIYDKRTLYWSSTLDPTDFVPSLITGAGSSDVLPLKGDIVVCYPIDDGFVIYTTGNVIVARYSGNARFPWNFKEIKNSAGVELMEHATPQGEANNFYTWSTNALLINGPTNATQAFPTVSEFLGQREYEVWDKVNKAITLLSINNKFKVKIAYVANRWLVISYGPVTLDYALVYDSGLKRWGKLRITHADCFEYFGNTGSSGATQPQTWAQLVGTWLQNAVPWFQYGQTTFGGAASLTTPYKSFGFLKADGSVQVVNFDLADTTADSVAIIGKIQFLRDKLFTITEVEAEGMGTEIQTKMQVWSSFDGYTAASKVYPFKQIAKAFIQKWLMKLTGINHSLVFMGNFHLVSVIARGLLAGKR